MAGRTPEETVEMLVAAFADGDGAGALELYDVGAVLVTEAGELADRRESLAAAIEAFAEARPRIDTRARHTVVCGDLALYSSDWRLEVETPDGTARQEGRSTDVLRRGADGLWRVAIDSPWGTRVLDIAPKAEEGRAG
ncbi:MAG: DUF4440 domain-containing protein [Gemmatimonadota bacterium]